MRSAWRIILVVVAIVLSAVTFASGSDTRKVIAHSQTSSANNHPAENEPVITNEAEYAEFVRKNEKLNSSSNQKISTSKKNSSATFSARSSSATTQ